jgi:hypothetical protein
LLALRQAPAVAIVEQKTSLGTKDVLAEVAPGSSGRFAAFDLTLTPARYTYDLIIDKIMAYGIFT